jgi:[ribosomal protein S18]-alanine N-acetyltransferase
MTPDTRAARRLGSRAVMRAMRAGDLPQILTLCREAFPADPWTTDTARGRLARSPLARRRSARFLERGIRLTRLGDAVRLWQFVRYLALDKGNSEYGVVVEADAKIAGFGWIRSARGEAEIQIMAVRADCQHQGIGKALLGNLITVAAARGCDNVVLHVRADNWDARRLYQRAGFTDQELRREFYQPSGTDAVVMRLRNGGSRGQHDRGQN